MRLEIIETILMAITVFLESQWRFPEAGIVPCSLPLLYLTRCLSHAMPSGGVL
jgi:hypothetical protein